MEFAPRSCMPPTCRGLAKEQKWVMHSVSTILKTLIHLWKKNTYQEKGQRLAFPESTWLNSFPSFCLRLTYLFWWGMGRDQLLSLPSKNSTKRFRQNVILWGLVTWVSNGWWSPSMKWIDDLDLQSFVWWNQVMRVGGAALQVSREMAMCRGRFHSYGRFWNPVGFGQRNTIWRVIA